MSQDAIRLGLANALRVIPETQVLPYLVGNPLPPTIWVARFAIVPDKAYGSRLAGLQYTDEYTATVQALTDFIEPQRAQELLDQYMAGSGVYSVKDAIETDKTLAGVCDTLWVSGWEGPSLSTFQTSSYLLSEWSVTIIATEVAL